MISPFQKSTPALILRVLSDVTMGVVTLRIASGPRIDPSISHPRRAIAIRLAQGTSSQIQASRAIATAAAVSSGDIVVNPGLKSGRNVQRRLPALQGEVAGADGALCGR